MFETRVETLTTDEALCYAADVQAMSAAAEVKLLQVAAHWADLHGVLDRPAGTTTLPGMEKLVRYGGDGTPDVAEFCCAELGAVLAMSPYAGQLLIADALDLRTDSRTCGPGSVPATSNPGSAARLPRPPGT